MFNELSNKNKAKTVCFGGGGEIRTLETLASLPPFQGGGINRYPTPPYNKRANRGFARLLYLIQHNYALSITE